MDGNNVRGKSKILNYVAVGFLVISLVAVAYSTNSQVQLIASEAKSRIQKTWEDIGSPGAGRHAGKVAEEQAAAEAAKQQQAQTTTVPCQSGCSASDITLNNQQAGKIGYQYTSGDIAGFYQIKQPDGTIKYFPIDSRAGGPSSSDLINLSQQVEAQKLIADVAKTLEDLGKATTSEERAPLLAKIQQYQDQGITGIDYNKINQSYVTQSDYNSCLSANNSPAECGNIQAHLGDTQNPDFSKANTIISDLQYGALTADEKKQDLAQLKTLVGTGINQDFYNQIEQAVNAQISAQAAAAASGQPAPPGATAVTPETVPSSEPEKITVSSQFPQTQTASALSNPANPASLNYSIDLASAPNPYEFAGTIAKIQDLLQGYKSVSQLSGTTKDPYVQTQIELQQNEYARQLISTTIKAPFSNQTIVGNIVGNLVDGLVGRLPVLGYQNLYDVGQFKLASEQSGFNKDLRYIPSVVILDLFGTPVPELSNRFTYQTGMTPEEAQNYRNNFGARLLDATQIAFIAVTTGDVAAGALGTRGFAEAVTNPKTIPVAARNLGPDIRSEILNSRAGNLLFGNPIPSTLDTGAPPAAQVTRPVTSAVTPNANAAPSVAASAPNAADELLTPGQRSGAILNAPVESIAPVDTNDLPLLQKLYTEKPPPEYFSGSTPDELLTSLESRAGTPLSPTEMLIPGGQTTSDVEALAALRAKFDANLVNLDEFGRPIVAGQVTLQQEAAAGSSALSDSLSRDLNTIAAAKPVNPLPGLAEPEGLGAQLAAAKSTAPEVPVTSELAARENKVTLLEQKGSKGIDAITPDSSYTAPGPGTTTIKSSNISAINSQLPTDTGGAGFSVDQIRQLMREGKWDPTAYQYSRDPITGYQLPDGSIYIQTGRHRVEAYILEGIDDIPNVELFKLSTGVPPAPAAEVSALSAEAKAKIIQDTAAALPNDGASPQVVINKLVAKGIPENEITVADIFEANRLAVQKAGVGPAAPIPADLSKVTVAPDGEPFVSAEAAYQAEAGPALTRRVTDIQNQVSNLDAQAIAKQIYEAKYTDGLTGLVNRTGFADGLDLEIASSAKSGTDLTVVTMDLKQFKVINDTFGHATGDDALKIVADTLKRNARSTDLVVRISGDEYAFVLPQTNEAQAQSLMQRVLADLENQKALAGADSFVKNLNIDYAVKKWGPTDTVDGFLNNLDLSMYEQKRGVAINPVAPTQAVPAAEIAVKPSLADQIFGESRTVTITPRSSGNITLRPGDSVVWNGHTVTIPDPAKTSVEIYWEVANKNGAVPQRLTPEGFTVNLSDRPVLQFGPLGSDGTLSTSPEVSRLFGNTTSNPTQIGLSPDIAEPAVITRANPQPGVLTIRDAEGNFFPVIRKGVTNVTDSFAGSGTIVRKLGADIRLQAEDAASGVRTFFRNTAETVTNRVEQTRPGLIGNVQDWYAKNIVGTETEPNIFTKAYNSIRKTINPNSGPSEVVAPPVEPNTTTSLQPVTIENSTEVTVIRDAGGKVTGFKISYNLPSNGDPASALITKLGDNTEISPILDANNNPKFIVTFEGKPITSATALKEGDIFTIGNDTFQLGSVTESKPVINQIIGTPPNLPPAVPPAAGAPSGGSSNAIPIGRGQQPDFFGGLDNSSVSRLHGEIVVNPDRSLTYIDTGSTYGTTYRVGPNGDFLPVPKGGIKLTPDIELHFGKSGSLTKVSIDSTGKIQLIDPEGFRINKTIGGVFGNGEVVIAGVPPQVPAEIPNVPAETTNQPGFLTNLRNRIFGEPPPPPITPGETFDPQAELSSILKAPTAERPAALAAYKSKLAYQQSGVADIQTTLQRAVAKNPDISIEELQAISGNLSSKYGLSNFQKELLNDALNKAMGDRSLAAYVRNRYPNDADLFEALFGRKPLGKVKITEGTLNLKIEVFNGEDYDYIYAGDFSSEPGSPIPRGASNSTGGFFSRSGTLIPEIDRFTVKNSSNLFIRVFSGISADQIMVHEEQHALNDLLMNVGIYQNSYTSSAYFNFRTAIDTGDLASVKSTAAEYANNLKLSTNAYAKDEILAFSKEKGWGSYGNLTAKGGPYDFYANARNDLLSYSSSLDNKEMAKILADLANQEFSASEYKALVRDSLKSVGDLIGKGYTRDEAVALLETSDLANWPKLVARTPSINPAERILRLAGDFVYNPENVGFITSPLGIVFSGSIAARIIYDISTNSPIPLVGDFNYAVSAIQNLVPNLQSEVSDTVLNVINPIPDTQPSQIITLETKAAEEAALAAENSTEFGLDMGTLGNFTINHNVGRAGFTTDMLHQLFDNYYTPSPDAFIGSGTLYGNVDLAIATILQYQKDMNNPNIKNIGQMQRGYVLIGSGKYGYYNNYANLLSSQKSAYYQTLANQNLDANGQPIAITYDGLNDNQKRIYNFKPSQMVPYDSQIGMSPQAALASEKYVGIIATKSINDIGRRFLLYKNDPATGKQTFVGVVLVGDSAKAADWTGQNDVAGDVTSTVFRKSPLGFRVVDGQQWAFDLTSDLYSYFGGTGGAVKNIIAVDPDAPALQSLSKSPVSVQTQGSITNKEKANAPSNVDIVQNKLDTVSDNYVASNNNDMKLLAANLGGQGAYKFDYGDNFCGPLSAQILKDAGLFQGNINDMYLLNPKQDLWRINKLFPSTGFTQINKLYTGISVGSFDWKSSPLKSGDFVYLATKPGQNKFEHMLVVTEVDAQGRAYSVTNFTNDGGKTHVVEKVLLYDPNDPTAGMFYKWTNPSDTGQFHGTGDNGFLIERPTSITIDNTASSYTPASVAAGETGSAGKTGLSVPTLRNIEFPYFSQLDAKWDAIPTSGKATVANDGCGIITGAMVTRTDPYTYWQEYSNYFKSIGQERVIGTQGTSFDDHKAVLEGMGYKLLPIQGSVSDIKTQIKNYTDNGVPVWVNAYIYGVGHNTEAIGVDPNNNIIFNDPYWGQNKSISDKNIDEGTNNPWKVYAVIPP